MPIAQFSGLASGIDSKALIDAIVEARELVNEKRRSEIEHLNSENDALEELNTKFLALNDLIDPLRTANSGGLTKKASSSDPTVATAIVGSNATNAAYGLSVLTVANAATGSFTNSYASGSTAVSTAGSGNVTVTVGLGADQVVITAAVTQNVTTLDQLVSAINNDANASGRVAAAAVNVGTTASPSYKLVLTTLQQGTAEGTLALAADPALTELSGLTTIEQATDATFTIDGISGTITRATNAVDDVISGMTFNLTKAGDTTITVGNDADTTADTMDEIVSAFNEIVDYINENDQITRDDSSSEGAVIYGSLAKTRIDNDFLSFFRSAISSATASGGTSVTSMSEIGLSTNRDGTIEFDADAFKSAVGEDPIGVGEVLNSFADSVAGVSGSIYQFTKLQGFIDVGEQANNDEIDNLNEAIAGVERQTAKLRQSLERQFANLESVTSRLQSQQSALSGVLAGLGG